MEFFNQLYSEHSLDTFGTVVDEWFFFIALAFFIFELIRYALKKQLSKKMLGDSLTNFSTLALYLLVTFLIGFIYLGAYFYVYEHFRVTEIPLTGWTVLGCLLLADLAYYWEHRFLHSNGIGWATHTVHHSSGQFNISVAYRFGPLDGFFPVLFHLPLVVLGFNPVLVILCEKLVLVYQTLLHTESVKKLPRPIEAIFNTASHHRVHHATNSQYLDKNYAGILIIWDRMFGTFAREEETVRYGVYPRINTGNPLKVFFGGYGKLIQKLVQAPNWRYRFNLLFKPPIWVWQQEQAAKKAAKS